MSTSDTYHMQNITNKYNKLLDGNVFDNHPFNLLSVGERVIFATSLVEEDNRNARYNTLKNEHTKILSEVNDIYYIVK